MKIVKFTILEKSILDEIELKKKKFYFLNALKISESLKIYIVIVILLFI